MFEFDRGAHDVPDLLMQLLEPFREGWSVYRRWCYLVACQSPAWVKRLGDE